MIYALVLGAFVAAPQAASLRGHDHPWTAGAYAALATAAAHAFYVWGTTNTRDNPLGAICSTAAAAGGITSATGPLVLAGTLALSVPIARRLAARAAQHNPDDADTPDPA